MKTVKLLIFGSRCHFGHSSCSRSQWDTLNLLIRHVKRIIFLHLWSSMNLWTNRRVDGWGCLLIFMTDLSDSGKNRRSNHEIFSSFQLRVSRPGLQNKHCQIWFYGSNPEAVMCPNCLFWQSGLLYHLNSERFEDIAKSPGDHTENLGFRTIFKLEIRFKF